MNLMGKYYEPDQGEILIGKCQYQRLSIRNSSVQNRAGGSGCLLFDDTVKRISGMQDRKQRIRRLKKHVERLIVKNLSMQCQRGTTPESARMEASYPVVRDSVCHCNARAILRDSPIIPIG